MVEAVHTAELVEFKVATAVEPVKDICAQEIINPFGGVQEVVYCLLVSL